MRMRYVLCPAALCAVVLLGACQTVGPGSRRPDRPGRRTEIEGLRANAELGVAEAQYALAVRYRMGNGIGWDEDKAFLWAKRAADQELPDAQFLAGYMHETGIGTPIDHELALNYYLRASTKDHMRSMHSAAFLMATSYNTDLHDPERAIELAQRVASTWGTPRSRWTLAAAFARKGEFDRAVGILEEALQAVGGSFSSSPGREKLRTEATHPELDAALDRYRRGIPVTTPLGIYRYIPNVDVKALAGIRAAAEEGNPRAQLLMGCYYAGQVSYNPAVRPDIRRWMQKAGDQGLVHATALLGTAHMDGVTFPRDLGKAHELLRTASDAGSLLAKSQLGALLHLEAQTDRSKLGEAELLTREAAEGGIVDAQYNWGRYLMSKGEYEACRKWLQSAAAQHHATANAVLACNYAASAHPVHHDGEKALRHARKAVAQEPDVWMHRGTLAKAYARCGDFPAALREVDRAEEMLRRENADVRMQHLLRLQAQRELYLAGKPFTQRPSPAHASPRPDGAVAKMKERLVRHKLAARSLRDHPIHMAIKQTDLEGLAKLLAEGADSNRLGKGGWTPLTCAALARNARMIRLLIENGADVNKTAVDGSTPLEMVAFTGDAEICRMLLEAGADPDGVPTKRDATSMPAVVLAALGGHLHILEQLLDAGAEIDEVVAGGTTALSASASIGRADSVKFLLEKGADPHFRNQRGFTILHVIADLDPKKGLGGIVTQAAQATVPFKADYAAVVDLLLNAGLEKDQETNGVTPLSAAALRGNTAVAAELIRRGADTEFRDKAGFTPLISAAESGYDGLIRMLLEHRADVNATNNSGKTALMVAASFGREACIPPLLDAGAGVNALTADGFTPLHAAAMGGWPRAAECLLEAGADLAAPSTHTSELLAGSTALHLSCLRTHFESLGVKKNGSAEDFHQLHQVLLKAGADPNLANGTGETPLHLAVRYGDSGAVTAFLSAEADPNVLNKKGWTPLHYAVSRDQVDVVKCLLSAGADAEREKHPGGSARELAVKLKRNGMLSLMTRYGPGGDLNRTQN